MTQQADQVRALIDGRKSIKPEDLDSSAMLMFSLALKEHDAAEEMLRIPNRLVQTLSLCVKKQDFIDFAQKYPDLIEKLIEYALLDNEDIVLANRMREHAPLSGRTQLLKAVPDVKIVGEDYFYNYGGKDCPVVTRRTRVFSAQILFSIGASGTREYIKLDPESPKLKTHYNRLMTMLTPGMSTEDILKQVSLITQGIFVSTDVDDYIAKNLASGNMVIGLDEFAREGLGVCRHHTLLNAYFLSRLVRDHKLMGEVIHHRQDIPGGAHTWNLFIDNKSTPKKLYSLDSLWKSLICLSDNPGALDKLYSDRATGKKANVEQLLQDRFNISALAAAQPEAQQPQAEKQRLAEEPEQRQDELGDLKDQNLLDDQPMHIQEDTKGALPKNSNRSQSEIIAIVKSNIEKQTFQVGDYFFFQGGKNINISSDVKKRVPHRVADIYCLIIELEQQKISAPECLEQIKATAVKALRNPRPGRKQTTTTFYQSILEENLPEILDSQEVAKVYSL